MHIEIGILSPEKIAYASAGATALIAAYSADWLKSPHYVVTHRIGSLLF